MKPTRMREETRRCTSTLQPRHQTQFSLFTTPRRPVAATPGLLRRWGEKTPNKSIFLERLIPPVVCMDIQCGCMFGDQSDTMEARANQRRTSRSNFFLEVNRGHLGNKSAPTIFQVAVGPRKRWRSDRPPLPSPLSH